MDRFEIRLPPSEAPPTAVILGDGAWEALPTVLPAGSRVLVVTDARVAALPWWPNVSRALGEDLVLTVLEPGEERKTLRAVERLWGDWSAAGAGRDSVVVAVGGGVVTDVAGFAAATHVRGVPWVAVPTTVLGMADAALGGKTGVNTPAGKNLAGAVHPPLAVVADTRALATLDRDTWIEGWAEVVKAGVIGDAALFEALEDEARRLADRSTRRAEELLGRSQRVKAAVVEADAREESRREILNFGHTVAHALERATGHAVRHGAAVAVGLVAEARLAEARGRLPAGSRLRIERLCSALGLPVRLPEGTCARDVGACLVADKKRRAGRLRVALPAGWGSHDARPGVEVEESELLGALE